VGIERKLGSFPDLLEDVVINHRVQGFMDSRGRNKKDRIHSLEPLAPGILEPSSPTELEKIRK